MDKFYIIGIRYNPQLGSYLSEFKICKPKINKTCISVKIPTYGTETKNLKFALNPSPRGFHWCKTSQSCVYGGYDYEGYSDKATLIMELNRWLKVKGSSSERAKVALEQIKNI